MSSSCWAEAIRGRAGCAAQEQPPTEGLAQRLLPGRALGPSGRGGAGPSGGRSHSPPPRTGAAGEAEDGNTLLRR